MKRKFEVSYEERICAVEKYLRHEYSMTDLSKQLKVHETTIMEWIGRYQSLGSEGLKETI